MEISMPTATTISIADSTPANHVFSPVQVSTGQALLLNRATSVTAAGNEQMVLGLSLASAKRRTDRVNIRLNVPHEETVDGVTTVRDVARFSADVVLPELMTQTERNHFAALVKSAMAHAIVAGYIANRDPLYG
jgi:predicted rRNA methylase YqxC with S4 and FtsJ domains